MTAAGATLTLDSTETQADSDLAAGTLAVTIGSATRLSCELPVVASTVTQRRFSVAVTSEDAANGQLVRTDDWLPKRFNLFLCVAVEGAGR